MAKTFERRLPDLCVDTVISFGDGMYQVEGKDINGANTWMLVTLDPEFTFRPSTVAEAMTSPEPDNYSRKVGL